MKLDIQAQGDGTYRASAHGVGYVDILLNEDGSNIEERRSLLRIIDAFEAALPTLA